MEHLTCPLHSEQALHLGSRWGSQLEAKRQHSAWRLQGIR